MIDLANYSSAVASILGTADAGKRLMPLAPKGPVSDGGLDLLRKTPPESLLEGAKSGSNTYLNCTLSALYLYFSALDESHTISQDIPNTTGSWLHGIMHRQEPDFSNAKYWFRRVGDHELFPTLRADVLRLSLHDDALIAAIEGRSEWDPFWFVDQVEKAVHGGGSNALESDLKKIQRLEWQLVFDYSYRRALAG